MKCKTMIFGLSLGLVAGLMWMPGSAADGQDFALMGGGESPFGFGKKIAGTWYTNSEPFGGSITVFADGNISAISGTCCGNAPNVQSEAFGRWVRTGPRSIELTGLVLATQWQLDVEDEDGHFHTGPADVIPGVWGQNWVATAWQDMYFDEAFENTTGTLQTAVWFADPDTQGLPNIFAEDAPPPDLCVGPFPTVHMRMPVVNFCE